MLEPFTRHPRTVGESYWQHLRFAAGTGAAMLAGGSACLVHGLLPFLFTTTGSATIRRLAARLAERRPLPPRLDGHPAALAKSVRPARRRV
jgi:hypothetical protein